ncbi:hypothetical protein QR98_0084690 [Sarcoptes scabiei]|uniref:Uncharacterized protein n=1 Tax=Sarcoptes scabiei TaxID=52283 RepID=A0A132AG68_SARSC|nr:hypothetical protein QR98_0084690 [Sarcoptes scabiei]
MSDHWDRNLGGGLLSIYGTNLIDIISYITGYRATRVHGLVNSIKQLKSNPIFYSCTEDYVNFQMEMHPNSKNCTRLLTMKKAQSISATVILNGHFYNDQPKHEIYVYGTKGYLVCRDGDLYSFRFDSNNRATNSNLDDPHSLLSKTSYLASKETLLHSSLKISTMKKSSTTIANKMNESYVYPQIYLLGIKNMITALKNAFLIQTYRNDNPKHHNYLIQNPIEEFKLNYPYRERNLDSDLDYSSNDSQQHSDEHHHHFLSEKNENEYDWTKRPVDQAVNFEDGIYLQQVIEAIHISSQTKEWIRI